MVNREDYASSGGGCDHSVIGQDFFTKAKYRSLGFGIATFVVHQWQHQSGLYQRRGRCDQTVIGQDFFTKAKYRSLGFGIATFVVHQRQQDSERSIIIQPTLTWTPRLAST
jgi:hypothetical protein